MASGIFIVKIANCKMLQWVGYTAQICKTNAYKISAE